MLIIGKSEFQSEDEREYRKSGDLSPLCQPKDQRVHTGHAADQRGGSDLSHHKPTDTNVLHAEHKNTYISNAFECEHTLLSF